MVYTSSTTQEAPVANQDVYEKITQKLIEQLKAGVVPWHKPWQGGFQQARNLRTGKTYRGINALLLSTAVSGHSSPYWATFKQVKDLGGKVKKGEKGSLAVFWKRLKVSATQEERAAGMGPTKVIPFLRYYVVFNVNQCEGLKVPETVKRNSDEAIEAAEALLKGYEKGPQVNANGDAAYYSPTNDAITMPPFKSFESAPSYYSVFFHEAVHSTGHKDRLAREGVVDPISFGSHKYSKEELVAEIGAAFLAAETGIDGQGALLDNSAAYIGHWLSKLENDHKLVVQAAGQAQRAADLIKGVKYEEEKTDEAEEIVAA
jgi:antirestriction protein ArdC